MNYLMNRVPTSPASPINLASLFSRKSTIRILAIPALASFALLTATTLAPAQSSAPLDKTRRRIEKRLTKYRQGTFLDFEFRDSSQTFGFSVRCRPRHPNSPMPTATRPRRTITQNSST